MDWQVLEDQGFAATANEWRLHAKPTDLINGVLAELNGQPQVNICRLADDKFVEKQELTFVRGTDLFAVFEKEHQTTEIYWRLMDSRERNQLLVESIVSLRSSKLVSEPIEFTLHSGSREPADQIKIDAHQGFQTETTTWFTWIHPDDQPETSIMSTERGAEILIRVPSLERGVIRRVRLITVIKPGEISNEELSEVSDRFANSAIPLTT